MSRDSIQSQKFNPHVWLEQRMILFFVASRLANDEHSVLRGRDVSHKKKMVVGFEVRCCLFPRCMRDAGLVTGS